MESQDRASWFKDARLGMFVHWGLYAQHGGYWRGQPYFGLTEYLPQVLRVPMATYGELACDFNPVEFDAGRWAKSAREAGFRYIVITAKHHDGFAMFESASDPFNIVHATPFGRDVIKELAEAVRAEGLAFGFYYSQYLDWHDRDAAGNDWDYPASDRNFDAYMTRKALPQIKELLTQYGKIDLFWFDIPGELSEAQSRRFIDLARSLQPDILVNSRIGNGLGDFETFGDNEIPPRGPGSKPWEAIFTHNHSWGYSGHDHTFKSPRQLIQMVATVVARDGNCMINVGPKPDGRFPEPTELALGALGDWLSRNGESIYGAGRAEIGPVPWGVITATAKAWYLHVFERPLDGRLIVPHLAGIDVKSASLLATAELMSWDWEGNDLVIELRGPLPDLGSTVIKIDYAGACSDTGATNLLSHQQSELVLDPANAILGPGVSHCRIAGWSIFGRTNYFTSLTGLMGPEDYACWDVRVLEPGVYWLEMEYAANRAQADRVGMIRFASREFPFQVLETGEIDPYRVTPITRQELGQVVIDEPGTYRLVLRPAEVVGGGYLLNSRPVHRDTEMFVFKRLILSPFD